MKYLELNDENIVFNVGETDVELIMTDKLLVGDYDKTYLSMKYDNGIFISVPVVEDITIEE